MSDMLDDLARAQGYDPETLDDVSIEEALHHAIVLGVLAREALGLTPRMLVTVTAAMHAVCTDGLDEKGYAAYVRAVDEVREIADRVRAMREAHASERAGDDECGAS